MVLHPGVAAGRMEESRFLAVGEEEDDIVKSFVKIKLLLTTEKHSKREKGIFGHCGSEPQAVRGGGRRN